MQFRKIVYTADDGEPKNLADPVGLVRYTLVQEYNLHHSPMQCKLSDYSVRKNNQ